MTPASHRHGDDSALSAVDPVDEPRPTVTIITATLQAARTIGHTLDSVGAQTCQDLEHIVIDGGSTDGTLAIARTARHRVRVVSESDHGIFDAFNRGLRLARGRWVNFLNADDAFAHERVVERVLAEAERRPDVELLYGDVDVVDGDGNVSWTRRHPSERAPLRFDLGCPINHQSMFTSRELLMRLGGFDMTYALAGDYDLLLRADLHGLRRAHIAEVLVRYRKDGRSADELSLWFEYMRVWGRRTGRLPWRQLARITRTYVLDPRAPRLAAALAALKHVARPPHAG